MNYPGAIVAIIVGVALLTIGASITAKAMLIGAGVLAIAVGVALAFRDGPRPG
jgi:hypothetical protein